MTPLSLSSLQVCKTVSSFTLHTQDIWVWFPIPIETLNLTLPFPFLHRSKLYKEFRKDATWYHWKTKRGMVRIKRNRILLLKNSWKFTFINNKNGINWVTFNWVTSFTVRILTCWVLIVFFFLTELGTKWRTVGAVFLPSFSVSYADSIFS